MDLNRDVLGTGTGLERVFPFPLERASFGCIRGDVVLCFHRLPPILKANKLVFVKTQKHGSWVFFRAPHVCICGRQEGAVEGLFGV